jgi:hypothetical protein
VIHQDALERLHDLGRLHGVARRADLEIDVRFRDAQLLEEQLAHRLVVVLAGVDQERLDGRMAGVRRHQRCDLDQIRSCPDHVDDLHTPILRMRSVRLFQCTSRAAPECADRTERVL